MSTTASSMTTARATTNPARIMVLIVAPVRWRATRAANSDSGMATTLIKAFRQSEQECADHQNKEDGADDDRLGQIEDRILDVRGQSEDACCRSRRREDRGSTRKVPVDSARDLQRVGRGKLLDDEEETVAVIETASPISGGCA